jgi:diaminohydroxyphosphoribosylaminopyrimidine deaminase/5-amino-6-(5-phosphoribosylamino)uracil reductase
MSERLRPTALDLEDERWMGRALRVAATARLRTSPNPWVGAVLVTAGGAVFTGATAAPGGPHAERAALEAGSAAAGGRRAWAAGSTLYVTLEPCAHHGRTAPCTEAILAAGVSRVVVGVLDPDERVRGRGIAALEDGGVVVRIGVRGREVEHQLEPYLHHRRRGRPFVVLKLAATLDGRLAAPDGSSRWITGPAARRDAHRLRAESDAIAVGATTLRVDRPALDVRGVPGARSPRRLVVRSPGGERGVEAVPTGFELLAPPLDTALRRLGSEGVVQLLVEGGASTAHGFWSAGLVDRLVVYLAPALLGGSDGVPLLEGPGAPTMSGIWRSGFSSVRRLGDDLRLDVRGNGEAGGAVDAC